MQRTTALRRKRRTNLFQMICFEIAVCMLFSAVGWMVIKSIRSGQMADGLLFDGANVETAGDAGTSEDDEAADGSGTEEGVAGADVLDTDADAAGEAEQGQSRTDQYVCAGTVSAITEDGAMRTDISPTILMLHGMDQDDLVSVTVGEKEYILPIELYEELPSYWGRTKLAYDADSDTMAIVRSYQDFAMMEGYTDREIGDRVEIKLLQSDAYQMKEKVRPKLVSVRAASNFRNVQTGNLGVGVLFRGHSPIFPDYGSVRCKFSDDFAWENQVNCVLNLNQDQSEVEEMVHEKCPESYYRYLFDSGKVSAIELDGTHSFDDAFELGIAAHLRFLLKHNGPYMVHCRMGKDRAGFVVALLQALEGSTYDEIGEEYAKSFRNYYGIREGSWMDRYNQTDGANTFLEMMQMGGTEQYAEDDGTLTYRAARHYMMEIGLAEEEIEELREKLARDIVAE